MIEPPGHTLMDDTIRRQFRCFRVMKHFFQTRCLGHDKGSRRFTVARDASSVNSDQFGFKGYQAVGIAIADNVTGGCTGKMRTDD
jgi:hypothetical protein